MIISMIPTSNPHDLLNSPGFQQVLSTIWDQLLNTAPPKESDVVVKQHTMYYIGTGTHRQIIGLGGCLIEKAKSSCHTLNNRKMIT